MGANILLELAGRGRNVVACDYLQPPDALVREAETAPGEVTWADLDVRSASDWDRLPRYDYDEVIHAAALTPGSDDTKTLPTAEVNMVGALRAMEWSLGRGADRFVFVSSSAVYRGFEATAPMREDSILQPEFSYGILKLATEGLLAEYRERRGLDSCSVRLPSLFGPWERPTGSRDNMSVIYHVCRAAISGQPLTVAAAKLRRDWLYVRDAARGLVHLASLRGGPPLINLGTGELTAIEQVVDHLDELLPRHGVVSTTGLEEGISDITVARGEAQPMAVDVLRKSGFVADTPLGVALAEYLEWLREHPE